MIYRHSPEQVQEYYERIGINQSALKLILDEGIEMFLSQYPNVIKQNDLYYEEKKHFVIGSAVDTHMTHGEDIFKAKYHLSELTKKPGDKAMSVIKLAFDKANQNFPAGVDADMKLYRSEVYEACNDQTFYMNRVNKEGNANLDTRIDTLLKDNGNAYWYDLIRAGDKQILSDSERTLIDSIIMSLTTHSHTAHLFKDSDDVDIVYQFPLYWVYDDVDCKGLIDIIIINHTQKRILPIDLKTIGDFVTKFNRAIKKRRYDIQASFYSYGLTQCTNELSTLIGKSLTGYTMANFAFIVESTIKPGCPLIFPLTTELLEVGSKGDEKSQGWHQGIQLFKEWSKVDFQLEKRFGENNGVLFVDSDYNYLINF